MKSSSAIIGKRRMDSDVTVSNIIIEAKNEFAIVTPPNQCHGLVRNIEIMLDKLEPPPSSERCIYRVPEKLRNVNKEAYTPHVISIGPFHHGNKKLKSMEEVKKRYLKKLVGRNSANFSLKSYVEFVKEQEGKIRQCYSEHIGMKSDKFVTMVLIDSCFIIELLLISYYTKCIDEDHPSLFLVPLVSDNIELDLILLENQVPFFVLEGLFSLATDTSFGACSRSLLDLSLEFFANFNKQKKTLNSILSVKHFTDLILTLYRPLVVHRCSPLKNERFQNIFCCTDLNNSGVTFKASPSIFSCTELNESGVTFKASPSKCLFDISFTNEVLEIPSVLLDDHTETHFRNLMALELCHYPNRCYLTDYIVFIDNLINTTRDVDLLVRKKIIDNCLGDNKAATNLFNNLCVNVPFDDVNSFFSRVCQDLNAFYEVPWHRSKAMLKRDYFKSPWRTASTIAAITLLALTFIQTVCSIVSTARCN